MATSEYLYYDMPNHNAQYPQTAIEHLKFSPPTTAMPEVLQFVTSGNELGLQRPQQQSPPVSTVKHFNPGQRYQQASYCSSNEEPPTKKERRCTNDSKPPTARPMSRSEMLKRRSSLREAARSLRPSKVAKRLRQVIGDADAEDNDDAGVSASESDCSASTTTSHERSQTPSSTTPNLRHQSVVSDITNGLQDNLNIGGSGRGRLSSSASQASTLVVDISDSASTRASFTTLSNTSKRRLSTEDERLANDGEDEDDNRLDRKASTVSSLGLEQPQLFACPFAKHDSHRYSAANLDELNYRGCAQSYLTDLARVKQHLYRVHERTPHHCPQCYEIFKSQAQCIKHVESQSCAPRPCPFDEKMTSEQLAAIKKKNRGTDPYLGWYEIYKTLFPGSPLPLSPYAAFTANTDTLESFMDFVVRELPGRLRHQLGAAHPLSEVMRTSLPAVLRDIRRDFSPASPAKVESAARSTVAGSLSNASDTESGVIPNFYQMVTTTTSVVPDPTRSRRSSGQEISVEGVYDYIPTQVTQMVSKTVPPSTNIQVQQRQSQTNTHYMYQQFNYSGAGDGLIQSVSMGPPTAIWQPDVEENVSGYFTVPHDTQQMLPSHLLQVDAEESWLPTMVTTRVDQSIADPRFQDMLGGMFYDGFGNHQR